MDPLTMIIVGLVSIVIAYYLIYASVLAALRAHTIWKMDGSAERYLARRNANNTD